MPPSFMQELFYLILMRIYLCFLTRTLFHYFWSFANANILFNPNWVTVKCSFATLLFVRCQSTAIGTNIVAIQWQTPPHTLTFFSFLLFSFLYYLNRTSTAAMSWWVVKNIIKSVSLRRFYLFVQCRLCHVWLRFVICSFEESVLMWQRRHASKSLYRVTSNS